MGIICSLIDATKRTAKIFFCGLAESVFNVAMIRFKVDSKFVENIFLTKPKMFKKGSVLSI